MSDYQYIDGDNDKLWIDKIRAGVILIGTMGASREVDACASVYVDSEHAPAIALAILEAAGYGKTEAAGFVRGQVDALVKKAEREAEDAKIREFRESSMTAIATVFNESSADSKDWDGLSATAREGWRARYRAARRFFEEA